MVSSSVRIARFSLLVVVYFATADKFGGSLGTEENQDSTHSDQR